MVFINCMNHLLLSKDGNSDNCCSCLSAQKTFTAVSEVLSVTAEYWCLIWLPLHLKKAAGRRWRPKPLEGAAPGQNLHSLFGYPLSWSTHSSITSHESLWSVHCHSKGHSAVSKPSSSPPRGCSELETPNTSEHLYSLWIHYLACLTHMVCKWMPVSLFCFRISGDADRCYSKCGPSASPGDLLEMQNFKPHP